MIEIPLGYNHQNSCPDIGRQGDSNGAASDWVELKNLPGTVSPPSPSSIPPSLPSSSLPSLVTDPDSETELRKKKSPTLFYKFYN